MNIPGSMTQVLPLEDSSQVGHARRVTQRLAEQHDFDATDAGRVALLTTELCTNVLKHAGIGELHLRIIRGKTSPAWKSSPWTVAPASARSVPDRWLLHRRHQGHRSGARWRGWHRSSMPTRTAEARWCWHSCFPAAHGLCLALRGQPAPHPGETACGDVWQLALDGSHCSVLVLDGIGHGESAQQAARAGAEAFGEAPFDAATSVFARMHQAMNGSRGGAVAIAQYDGERQTLAFAGIGNIGASLIGSEARAAWLRTLASSACVFAKAHVFDYPQGEAQLLLLFSDGLQSRWSLRDYPGLIQRHPAIIATLLHRDFCRGRDDVTVLALNGGPRG